MGPFAHYSVIKKNSAALNFETCPAKTRRLDDGSVVQGHTVLNHCKIVGEVAKALITLFPPLMRANLFPAGSEMAVACHDIGKVSPTFVAKILLACKVDISAIPELAGIDPTLEKEWGGHAGVSQATADELGVAKYVAEILGQHHGFNPQVEDKRGNAEVFGGPAWFDQRSKLVEALKSYLQTDWPIFQSAAQARVVAGLTSVADWIGSGSFFEEVNLDWNQTIACAISSAGFIKPRIRQNLTFSELFDPIARQMQPNAMQSTFALRVTEPGLYILEAQMGTGKTEAALYAAYQMLAQEKATGIYFALPTQLTSNKIYDRFNQFLTQIVSDETPAKSLLLHSGAWLLDTEMGEEGSPGGAWFNHKKRGLLAPFAVGTIDQALMAVMNVKHGFVRAFGLAGKVVILDEVHSYDLYTGTILNELIALLRQINCTVIVLSATLNNSQRETLLQQTTTSSAYPLISALPNGLQVSTLNEIEFECETSAVIELHIAHQVDRALDEAINRAACGERVLWIENTVAQAQTRYLDLSSRAADTGCGTGLLHSRFTAQQRAINEEYWVARYGRQGWAQRSGKGCILVGTQVLEQSLDIDADFLVSRFAPTDMLLQRIGRLWRHQSTPRPATAKAECWLLAPALEQALASPKAAFGDSALVYSPYILCRSLEQWQNCHSLPLPSGIRPLIDQTYLERDESGSWAQLLSELKHGSSLRTGQQAQQALARLTLAKGGKTLPEHKAETRYSDKECYDLLLLRNLRSENGISTLSLLDGRQLTLPAGRHRLTNSAWRKLSVALHQQVVRVSPAYSPSPLTVNELRKLNLHQVFYLGHPAHDEALLRVALVSEAGELLTLDGRPLGGKYSTHYHDDVGLRVTTHKE